MPRASRALCARPVRAAGLRLSRLKCFTWNIFVLEGMLEYARLRVCPLTFEQSWTVLCFINKNFSRVSLALDPSIVMDIGDNKKKLLLGRLNALDPAVNECQ